MPNIRCPEQEPEMLKKRASQSWLRAVAQTAATHTATGNAAAALPESGLGSGHKLFLFAIFVGPNFVQQFWCFLGLHFPRWLVGLFWLAGCILSPFLVPVLGTVFGP